jgi:hypothetical protein
MSNCAIHVIFLSVLLGSCLRPPNGSGAQTLAQQRLSDGAAAGILPCNAGTSCPESGLECTNSSGILRTCVGPRGAAYVTCNSELCYYETTVSPKEGAWSVTFPQNTYSVGLLVLSPQPDTTQ